MTQQLILNESQARAIYDAMCGLNNVDAALSVGIPSGRAGGDIFVSANASVIVRTEGCVETYPDQAAFAVGDFVLCEFKLWKVAEVVDGVVRELRGFGVLTGNFTEDRIFPLTHRGYTISRTVESNWTSLHDVSRGMQINFPMIHQQIEKAWQHAMNVLDQDAELDKAMREVHAIYSEFIRAIEQARGIRVLGVNLFRGA